MPAVSYGLARLPQLGLLNTMAWATSPPLFVTLGLYYNRSVERIKGNQATFDNSQRNNLRSCVWVFGGSVGEDVCAVFPPFGAENLFLISE